MSLKLGHVNGGQDHVIFVEYFPRGGRGLSADCDHERILGFSSQFISHERQKKNLKGNNL